MLSKLDRSKLLGILAGGLAVTGAAALFSGAAPAAAVGKEALARGAQLVQVGGCNHCHTPWVFEPKLGMPVPDMKRMLSGHPADAPDPEGQRGKRDIALIGPTFTSFAMPFGIVYAPNLTPDKDTGLGSWTEKMFVDAIKTGKHLGGNGRAILPPMPWMDLAQLTDSDLKALFAYLRSLPPLRNAVPGHKVPEPAYTAVTENMEKLKKAMREKTAAHP
jgi:mono/diheme cytochrome c family protein